MSNKQDKTKDFEALKLVDIHKIYGSGDNKVEALKGIDLCFRSNEFVSILGQSGCGKTTLLNIIGGLDRYTSGDLIIEGKSTKQYKDRDWDAYRNNCIGFVFQTYNLIPHQTVCENVELALELSGISKKERKAKALAMLKKVGLSDQAHKKPNQLSGGQMQRVAIARALINDPKIILADEPTGALDTETSVQVMDLLKEVAKERLVIMVTHNPELAQAYSTRIIKLLDGRLIDDSAPYTPKEKPTPTKMKKPKMGFFTAFMLSLKNLFSKKGRTILTSFAGSIGIFGIALVLALSSGFNSYMARMQTDTLSAYPLTISESVVDLSTFNEMYESDMKEKFPELDNVFVQEAFKNLVGMLKSNDLTDTSEEGFLHYLEQADSDLYYTINYNYGFNMNDYIYTTLKLNDNNVFASVSEIINLIGGTYSNDLASAMGGMTPEMVAQFIPTTTELPDSQLLREQYDLLHGNYPSFEDDGYKQVVLVVDEYNSVNDISLLLLGYISGSLNEQTNQFEFEDKTELTLEDVVGQKLYITDNNTKFYANAEGNYIKSTLKEDNANLTQLEIVGIIRPKKDVQVNFTEGLAYTPALTKYMLDKNSQSAIAKSAVANGGNITVQSFGLNAEGKPEIIHTPYSAKSLGGVTTPSQINIYAKDFDSKEKIKAYIDEWNNSLPENPNSVDGKDDRYIHYSDVMSDMFSVMTTLVDAVSYVLIAFTSISLIVSSVMIGIITYISVVERTREIGVLRALGASKREVSNVFMAETFIIGLLAGLIGVGLTYLISIHNRACRIHL